jgi:hypothetical protein
MSDDNDDTGSSESPLDDLFVEGARFREPSAAERAAWAKEQRKQVQKSKRQRRRDGSPTKKSSRRPVVAIAVLFLLTFVIFYVFNPGGGGGGAGNNAALLANEPREIAVSYAVPQGVTPNPNATAAIQADLAQTQAWFAAQTGGKQLRFKQAPDGAIDVQTQQLNVSVDDLKNQPAASNTIRDGLPQDNGEIRLAYVDVDRQTECGAGELRFAVVYMGSCGWSAGGTKIASRELIHALGAVASCAPHFAAGNSVTGPANDVMYSGAPPSMADAQLDPGHDDYYKHHIKDCIDIALHPAWTSI